MNERTTNGVWAPFEIVIFDCDSTLSTVEGIDELARMTGNQASVAMLTKKAMEGDIPLESVYGRRLVTVNPTQAQVQEIARIYRDTVIPAAIDVIRSLQSLGTEVFVVSGGLTEPVRAFGEWLGVARDHIFAVNMEYDQLSGEWWRYWEQPGGNHPSANYLAIENSPLTGTGGKNRVIARIRAEYPGRAMLIGDGLSDLEASPEVDLFVGFGGAVFRQRIAAESPVYIRARTLSPVLPLALGQLGNTPETAALWVDGLQRVYTNEVSFRDDEMRASFLGALQWRASNGETSDAV